MDTTNEDTSEKKIFKNVKSKYIVGEIFSNLEKRKMLEIIKYSKNVQDILEIGIDDYIKEYLKVIIEVIPSKKIFKNSYFINIPKTEDISHYHIFFNDSRIETKSIFFPEEEYISKIKIILDREFLSFSGLFKNCEFIEKIKFIKFRRNDIDDMKNMFSNCSSLKELNISLFNTNNVTDMSYMFNECSSLKELNVTNFNTNNVDTMRCMFYNCYSLKELNLSNFNTINVTNMSNMFHSCYSLKKLDISNFNTDNVIDMSNMFHSCYSLKKLDISNFNTDKVTDMSNMFSYCGTTIKLRK